MSHKLGIMNETGQTENVWKATGWQKMLYKGLILSHAIMPIL